MSNASRLNGCGDRGCGYHSGMNDIRDWDESEGPDREVRAESAAAETSPSVAGAASEDTIAVLLRGGPLDGESRLVRPDALLIDEPLTIVERDASEEAEAPGVVGVIEYLYRGEGVADYVGGLPADEQTNG